jgi:hypothetical protein
VTQPPRTVTGGDLLPRRPITAPALGAPRSLQAWQRGLLVDEVLGSPVTSHQTPRAGRRRTGERLTDGWADAGSVLPRWRTSSVTPGVRGQGDGGWNEARRWECWESDGGGGGARIRWCTGCLTPHGFLTQTLTLL